MGEFEISAPPAVSVTSIVYVVKAVGSAENVKLVEDVVGMGVVRVAVEVTVKSDHKADPIGSTVMVQTMVARLWITGVVQTSVEVDVAPIPPVIVYAIGDPEIAVPPVVKAAAME